MINNIKTSTKLNINNFPDIIKLKLQAFMSHKMLKFRLTARSTHECMKYIVCEITNSSFHIGQQLYIFIDQTYKVFQSTSSILKELMSFLT